MVKLFLCDSLPSLDARRLLAIVGQAGDRRWIERTERNEQETRNRRMGVDDEWGTRIARMRRPNWTSVSMEDSA